MRAVPDAVAQHIDRTALRDLALQPGQELPPRRTVVFERQRFGGLRLRGTQEGGELDAVDAELPVEVAGIAGAPAHAAVAGARLTHTPRLRRVAGMAGQRRADEAFKAVFGSVGGHHPSQSACLAVYTARLTPAAVTRSTPGHREPAVAHLRPQSKRTSSLRSIANVSCVETSNWWQTLPNGTRRLTCGLRFSCVTTTAPWTIA